MAKVTVYNLERVSVGEMDLSDEIFAREVNEALLHEVVRAQLASRRSGNASTKGRSETNGTTKKMYKQKGTGSARHGDRGAPNFVGGGQSHGPKPRSYAFRPNRKARIGAMQSALALKLKEGRLTVVDAFDLGEIKTKKLAGILDKLLVAKGSLIVDAGPNDSLRLSARNLDGHSVLPPEGVNVYDVLRHEHLVLTKSAAQALEARLKG
jgi:large subunit ribosomal protein L4